MSLKRIPKLEEILSNSKEIDFSLYNREIGLTTAQRIKLKKYIAKEIQL